MHPFGIRGGQIIGDAASTVGTVIVYNENVQI
jgi:hypothetical protein